MKREVILYGSKEIMHYLSGVWKNDVQSKSSCTDRSEVSKLSLIHI